MSFKVGRHIEDDRVQRYYKLLFDEIDTIHNKNDLTQRDKNFVIQTLKEIIGRVEHHELGEKCPTTDIDFLEVNWGEIVAITLKCRDGFPPTQFERKIGLLVSTAFSSHYKHHIPLLIEYVQIDEKDRTVGENRTIEWANKRIFRQDINKGVWKKFQLKIRDGIDETELYRFFGSLNGWSDEGKAKEET